MRAAALAPSPTGDGTTRHPLTALVVATVALGAAPGTAHGAIVTVGSDLSAPADTVGTHPVDTASWATRLASGASAAAPESGQLLGVRIKGIALRNEDTEPSNPALTAKRGTRTVSLAKGWYAIAEGRNGTGQAPAQPRRPPTAQGAGAASSRSGSAP